MYFLFKQFYPNKYVLYFATNIFYHILIFFKKIFFPQLIIFLAPLKLLPHISVEYISMRIVKTSQDYVNTVNVIMIICNNKECWVCLLHLSLFHFSICFCFLFFKFFIFLKFLQFTKPLFEVGMKEDPRAYNLYFYFCLFLMIDLMNGYAVSDFLISYSLFFLS